MGSYPIGPFWGLINTESDPSRLGRVMGGRIDPFVGCFWVLPGISIRDVW